MGGLFLLEILVYYPILYITLKNKVSSVSNGNSEVDSVNQNRKTFVKPVHKVHLVF